MKNKNWIGSKKKCLKSITSFFRIIGIHYCNVNQR